MGWKYKFPPQARLKKTREFENVFKNGCKIVKQSIVVFYFPNGVGETRLGLVVSKKVGKANVRNRIKRRLRELFRVLRSNASVGYDIVIIARRNSSEQPFAVLESDMRDVFEKLVSEAREA